MQDSVTVDVVRGGNFMMGDDAGFLLDPEKGCSVPR